MFDNIDQDDNNQISRSEIKQGFSLNSQQADDLMDKMDENGDGVVDSKEFDNYMDNQN